MLTRGAPRSRAVAAAVVLTTGFALALLSAVPASADHVRDQQSWVLSMIGAPDAWVQSQGQGVTVAVIDSGVNPHVSDLAGSVTSGPDLTGVHTPPSDPDWGTHGTWMATLVAGHGHGPGAADGIMGAAPRAKILSIRVVTDTGDPSYRAYQREPDDRVQSALARAIRYATGHHAGVISMSLGYGAPSRPVRAALQYALRHGTVIVASAGNSGNSSSAHSHGQAPYSFPAVYPGVLGVGAVAQDGTTAGFSSANLSVQVAAPGVMVPTQGRDGKYWYVNGTSPACALTAGVAALIRAKYPSLPPALVDQAITGSAQNPPPGGYDDKVGFGTVNATGALVLAGRLLRETGRGGRGNGVRGATHFGGGQAAVPPAPVRPRSTAGLTWFGLLGLACLVLTLLTGWRLARLRRDRRAAAAPAIPPPGPAAEAERARARFAAVPPPSGPREFSPSSDRTAAGAGPEPLVPYPAPAAGPPWGRPGRTAGWHPDESADSWDRVPATRAGQAGDGWQDGDGWPDGRGWGTGDDWEATGGGEATDSWQGTDSWQAGHAWDPGPGRHRGDGGAARPPPGPASSWQPAAGPAGGWPGDEPVTGPEPDAADGYPAAGSRRRAGRAVGGRRARDEDPGWPGRPRDTAAWQSAGNGAAGDVAGRDGQTAAWLPPRGSVPGNRAPGRDADSGAWGQPRDGAAGGFAPDLDGDSGGWQQTRDGDDRDPGGRHQARDGDTAAWPAPGQPYRPTRHQ